MLHATCPLTGFRRLPVQQRARLSASSVYPRHSSHEQGVPQGHWHPLNLLCGLSAVLLWNMLSNLYLFREYERDEALDVGRGAYRP